ncbi:MAG TPA: tape measure protein [Scandinavium sp.]
MAGNIDERIVEMSFRGSSFVAEIRASVNALQTLKSGLNSLKGSEGDLNSLDAAGKRFSLKGISNGLEGLAGKFTHLGIVGTTALATIANRAVNAGITAVKALTIDPIKAGLDVYETKINAIQTILANTSSEGTTLKQVTAALNQLNTYANLTVYNFGQMAKNIGTFTAAGVGLKTAVSSIKGIANLAALSGSSADQASNAMYQLSQAIAAGRVKLQDWNSVVNAGLGGKVFQNALVTTARATGVNIDAIIKKAGSFRNSLQQGWLSSKILTQTLDTFTGDLSKHQLIALGYTKQEADAILKQAHIAVQSATQIRTISQLFQALKEEVATAWSRVFEALIGNIGQATGTLSKLHNNLENFFTKPIYDLARFLQQWNDLGGRAKLIDAFTNGFKFLASIMHVVGSAFHDVFPPAGTGNSLYTLTTALDNFSKHLKLSAKDAADVKTIFEGVFSVFKIVGDLISSLVGGFSKVGGAASHSSGGFLTFIAMIASWITNLRKAIEAGDAFTKFFQFLGTVLSIPIKILGTVIGYFAHFGSAASSAAGGANSFVQKIGEIFSHLASAIAAGIRSGNFNIIVGLLNEIIVGGILLKIKALIANFGKGSGKGLFDTIKESFESLTTTLKTMQANLKAGILQKIAIAVGLLTVSLLVLSLIDTKNLVKALTAITVVMTELITAMSVVVKVAGSAGIVKMAAISLALNALAVAILILAGAVAIFAQFSWTQLAKGLTAIGVLLAELSITMLVLSKDLKGSIATAYSMQVMAVALNILALAVGRLGGMSLGNLAKGVGTIAALLLVLAGFNKISGEQTLRTSSAMLLLGAALLVISQVVQTLGSLSVGTLVKGLVSVGAALVIIALAMQLMPPQMIATSVGLLLVATALVILSKALKSMGGMSWEGIAKALVVLAGSLILIAAAMIAMTEALPGAAALLVVAVALRLLAPVLVALAGISWEGIAKGLITLVGVFVILAAAGIVLTPLIPSLLLLGVAITLLGVGLLAAGAGVALFGLGLTALAVAVTASGVAILSFVGNVLGLIPLAFTKIGQGVVAFAKAIGAGGKAITEAFTVIMSAVLDAVIKLVPKAATAFGAVMNAVLSGVNKYAPRIETTFLNLLLGLINRATSYIPKFVSAGTNFIVGLINGISRKIGSIISAAVGLVIAFINAIAGAQLRIISAGINMVIGFVNGVANRIRSSSGQFQAAAYNLGSAIIQGTISGIVGGIGGVVSAAVSMAKSALSGALHFLHIGSPSKRFRDEVGAQIPAGTALGVSDNTHLATTEVTNMGNAMLGAIARTMTGLNDAINSNLELQPTITPVVDLTQAKKGFGTLTSLSKNQLIAASASSTSAASISAANAAAAFAAGLAKQNGTYLEFNQTNISPTALSATDIYRKTKNQLSIAKGALSANSSNNN